MRFSLRTALILMTLFAVGCSISKCVGHSRWLITIVRLGSPLAIIGGIIWQLRHKGRSLEGLLSVAAFTLIVILFEQTRGREEPTDFAFYTLNILLLILFVVWFACAVSAIRTGQRPNRGLGALSLLCLLSPYCLIYLTHWQFLIYTFFDVQDSWRFRPMDDLLYFLWDS